MVNKKRTCIILSQGPVPTPEHEKVEGGGLRCWGLAKGLVANAPDLDVTVAYHESYATDDFTKQYEGIRLATWDFDTVATLVRQYDSVLVSYCMGELSVRVADAVRPDQQLILDCYVPIYIEVSARQSKRVEAEYQAFEHDVQNWARVLKRGDLFLCAHAAQRDFYKGVLAAVGRINPVTYTDTEELILIVPYGVYRDEPITKERPITKLIGDGDYLKIMWFGGIYPWFDIRELADAIREVNKKVPAKLIVVGAKNPFNKHPDFLARYDEFIEYVTAEDMKQYVVVQDWIRFDERANWYLDADAVIVFNKEGEENKLAWRTRLVDFMWADLPVLTNGGDPLGEAMIGSGAAIRMETLTPQGIADTIIKTLGGKASNLAKLKANMRRLRADYYWDIITTGLAAAVQNGIRARDLKEMGIATVSHGRAAGGLHLPLGKVMAKAKKVPAYANKYGYKTTALVINEMVRRKLQSAKTLSGRQKPAYVFVSHQLDMSGAPFIAIDMALEFKAAGKNIEFYTYLPAHRKNLTKLNQAGIKPHVLMNKDMVPDFIAGDTVILNTIAHSETVKETLFGAAEQGVIKQLIWYLHEDDPELLFRPDEQKRIQKMLKNGQAKLLIAATKIRRNYIEYFETNKNITLLSYRHIVPEKYHRTRKAADFSKKLTFVLPGTIGDGRKGQLPVLYAFTQFYNQYYKPHRETYRDFELVLIGMSDDFLSRQILAHAKAIKGHFSHYGKVTWEEDLNIVSTGNFTICYSIREALPLFVFEGMIAGHPVLRNDSSGMEEQLAPGKNGWYLDTNDFNQVVEVLETVLNKSKTSDQKLAAMSAVSYKMAKSQESNSYLKAIEE